MNRTPLSRSSHSANRILLEVSGEENAEDRRERDVSMLQQDVTAALPFLLATSAYLHKSTDLRYTAALLFFWQLEGTQDVSMIAEIN